LKTPKEEVQELLGTLPDDSTLEDIQYHLHVRQKISLGIEAAAQRRVVSHEEAARAMSRWLGK